MRFTEVADRVYVLRYPLLDVNSTLVVGDGEALLIDTLATGRQAAELAEAARRITSFPWAVVNTHHHFDHCFGNGTVADIARPVWAHEAAAALLTREAERMRREYADRWSRTDPTHVEDLLKVAVMPPTDTFAREIALDLGSRPVMLRHLGRGHTAGDVIVQVPDAGVVIAGDLVEESGPPSFGDDSYPLHWPATLAGLLRLEPLDVIVPGHGALVDVGFVKGQHAELTALEWTIRQGHRDGAEVTAVAARAPFGGEAARTAVRRGYAELDGYADRAL